MEPFSTADKTSTTKVSTLRKDDPFSTSSQDLNGFKGQTAPWEMAKKYKNRNKNRYGNIMACKYSADVGGSDRHGDRWLGFRMSWFETAVV
ncbi:hypothetical protein NHX12_029909 [Muraenolepis orangiensis]|uniref:Uncharacterized protein n=1 Tax=Muraenolepis orangiensis TaxID=630683 RepID=A0A9Q0EB26_9TELE|nr:hypothetical protein NHX12_029909 [Muraenolepis orangiensis]